MIPDVSAWCKVSAFTLILEGSSPVAPKLRDPIFILPKSQKYGTIHFTQKKFSSKLLYKSKCPSVRMSTTFRGNVIFSAPN